MVDEGGLAQRRPVELARRIGELRIIASGLEPEDLVVIGGLQRVRAGAAVSASEATIAVPATLATSDGQLQ